MDIERHHDEFKKKFQQAIKGKQYKCEGCKDLEGYRDLGVPETRRVHSDESAVEIIRKAIFESVL